MPNITLLISGGDSQSSLLPASKPTRGGRAGCQPVKLVRTGPCSHRWHWVTWQTWESRRGAPSSVTGDRVVLLWEVRGDLEGQTRQTCASQGWALLLEVTKKKVTLTTRLAASKYWKVYTWPFSDTQECAHYDFNDFILSSALQFSKTSPFKTVVHRFQWGMHASYFEKRQYITIWQFNKSLITRVKTLFKGPFCGRYLKHNGRPS